MWVNAHGATCIRAPTHARQCELYDVEPADVDAVRRAGRYRRVEIRAVEDIGRPRRVGWGRVAEGGEVAGREGPHRDQQAARRVAYRGREGAAGDPTACRNRRETIAVLAPPRQAT